MVHYDETRKANLIEWLEEHHCQLRRIRRYGNTFLKEIYKGIIDFEESECGQHLSNLRETPITTQNGKVPYLDALWYKAVERLFDALRSKSRLVDLLQIELLVWEDSDKEQVVDTFRRILRRPGGFENALDIFNAMASITGLIFEATRPGQEEPETMRLGREKRQQILDCFCMRDIAGSTPLPVDKQLRLLSTIAASRPV